MSAHFTVYVRHGCHLCEDLLQQMSSLQRANSFAYTPVDVDTDLTLRESYGHLVPIVTLGEKQICHYFLDQAALLQAVDSINN
ncbi:MAG: glutaredoxin family protein [Gammaproteobacteria bacterium]